MAELVVTPTTETSDPKEFTQFDQYEAVIEGLLKAIISQESKPEDDVRNGVIKYLKGQKGLIQALKLPKPEQTPENISRLVNEQSTRLDPIPDVLQMIDQDRKQVFYLEDAVDLVPPSQVKA